MSSYCREWASHHSPSLSELPLPDDSPQMTAHRPVPPQPHGPSPDSSTARSGRPSSPSISDDEDDDALSLGSSDLENSWLTVPRSEGGTSVSGSASALGSAAVSDLDPSSDSDDREWTSDFDSEGPTLRQIPNVLDKHYDNDSDDSDIEDTPSPLNSFQRSFIFPDPNSAGASISTIKDSDTTPVPSIVDITSQDLPSSSSLWESALSGRKSDRVKPIDAPGGSFPAGPSTETPKPFRAHPATPKRRQLTAFVSVFAFVLLFFKLGPAAINIDISGLIAKTFGPPGPLDAAPEVPTTTPTSPSRWLGADLQVMRDALSVFSSPDDSCVDNRRLGSKADPSVAETSPTEYRWFRNEYRWSRGDGDKPVTAVSVVPSSSLSLTGKQVAVSLNNTYDTLGSTFQDSVQLVSQYLAWSVKNIAAFITFSIDALRPEIEANIRQLQALTDTIAETLATSVASGAATSRQFIMSSLQKASRVSAHLRDEGYFSPSQARNVAAQGIAGAQRVSNAAADRFAEAQRRGHETLVTARKGLDNVFRIIRQSPKDAATQATTLYSADCLHDRDHKKRCGKSRFRRKDNGKAKQQRNKHNRGAKCSLTDRLARRCAGAAQRA